MAPRIIKLPEQAQRPIGELWIPGQTLDALYPPATQPQLQEAFGVMTGSQATDVHPDVLGTIRIPGVEEEIKGVISVDLCEVVRETARALSTTAGNDYRGREYMEGLWEVPEHVAEELEHDPEAIQMYVDNTIRSIVQVMANGDFIQPVNGIGRIGEMMKSWKNDDSMYIIANTSMAPGCELATLRMLDRYMPDVFDGVLFPRNHDGSGKIKKADALSFAIDKLRTYDKNPIAILNVDDTSRHNLHATERIPGVMNFMPLYNEQTQALAKLGIDLYAAVEQPTEQTGIGYTINESHIMNMLKPFAPGAAERIRLPLHEYENVNHGTTHVDTFRLMDDFIKRTSQKDVA